MSDYDDENHDDGEQEERLVTLSRAQIRAMEKKARAADEAMERAAAAERRLAFAEAGINPADKRLAYFAKAYDGEMTAEAIKAAATEAGFLTPAEPENQIPAQEREALRQAAEASRGAGQVSDPDVATAIAQATSQDEVMAILQRSGVPTAWDS